MVRSSDITVVRHKGTLVDTKGDTEQAVFIDVFYFVQENRKVKTGPEANALIH